ncbi:MAG: glycerol acyltransferase [Planctomycetota bacterium]|nr:MAG: glycerol acyltransferase [Planctomycetota bacterium]
MRPMSGSRRATGEERGRVGGPRPLLADRGFGRRGAGLRWTVLTLLGTLILRLMGFRLAGRFPRERKVVVIGAPHTSNWDFLPAIGCKWALALPTCYLIKHTLVRGPLGWLLRATGAIPVDRSQPGGVIEQLVRTFETREQLVLAIAPEGTRSWRPVWKSGFYRIAQAAGVPIVCCAFDYRHRRLVFSEPIEPTGKPRADMDRIRAFYRGVEGRRPEKAGPVRLRIESENHGGEAQR